MYCVFPHLYEGFPAYSPYQYMYIYWPWPPRNTSCLYLTQITRSSKNYVISICSNENDSPCEKKYKIE
jgi:hypothetical protein